MTIRTKDTINQEIKKIFADNNITLDGPGDEAFWNGVDDLEKVNAEATDRMYSLSKEWEDASTHRHATAAVVVPQSPPWMRR